MSDLVQVGDVIRIKSGMKIQGNIPKHFAYSNKPGDFSLTKTVFKVSGQLSYFEGDYIVTNTTMNGGGTGHGASDVYPDGWEVKAQKVDDEGVEITLYQSGCFIHTNTDIEVVGKSEKKWVIK